MQRVVGDGADERQRASGAAAGVLDDRLAGRELSSRSAPRTIASAIRSLYDPVGLAASIFTHTAAWSSGTSRSRRTSGVEPIAANVPSSIATA